MKAITGRIDSISSRRLEYVRERKKVYYSDEELAESYKNHIDASMHKYKRVTTPYMKTLHLNKADHYAKLLKDMYEKENIS